MYKKLLELINSAKMQNYRLKTQYTINTLKNNLRKQHGLFFTFIILFLKLKFI